MDKNGAETEQKQGKNPVKKKSNMAWNIN